jgi:hypothetical protein
MPKRGVDYPDNISNPDQRLIGRKKTKPQKRRRKISLGLVTAALAVPVMAADYVKPHVRKDGTHVEGHYRSSPNNYKLDNYSTEGNANPYTGRKDMLIPTLRLNPIEHCAVRCREAHRPYGGAPIGRCRLPMAGN